MLDAELAVFHHKNTAWGNNKLCPMSHISMQILILNSLMEVKFSFISLFIQAQLILRRIAIQEKHTNADTHTNRWALQTQNDPSIQIIATW